MTSGGKQNGWTPTFVAAFKGHVECIEALVRHGADVNKATAVSAAWLLIVVGRSRGAAQKGWTPTYGAALGSHLTCIDALVRHGADVNKATNVSRRAPVVAALADQARRAQDGKTPLDAARQSGDTECERVLRNHGAQAPSL